MALQHYYGHFEHGQLTYQHRSWEGFLSGQPVLSAHTCMFASNWQLLYLNQRQGENGRRNDFMTKSLRKDGAGPDDQTCDLLNTNQTAHLTDLAGPAKLIMTLMQYHGG